MRTRASRQTRNLLQYPYILWSTLFIVIPLALIIWYSFTQPVQTGGFQFSTSNYRRFFEPVYLRVMGRSLILAIEATLICLIVGYPAAMIIVRLGLRWRNTLLLLLVLPMWINFLLRTYSWMVLLGRQGVLNQFLEWIGLPPQSILYSRAAVLIGMVYNFLPFMILPLYTSLSRIGKEQIEAAEDLGANRFDVFRRIILPLSLPGILTGTTMVFMPAVSTFVISALLGGGQDMLIGNLIEQQFLSTGDWHFGSAVSILMMVIILISMAIVSVTDKGRSLEEGNLW
ncbi:MAG: ABC transporter permease [Spirochaetes bacterium]|nr:ABC transporter permease [Spirochaetota bacterium]